MLLQWFDSSLDSSEVKFLALDYNFALKHKMALFRNLELQPSFGFMKMAVY
jgi:hypothetical protein